MTPDEDITGRSVRMAPAFDILWVSLRDIPAGTRAITEFQTEPFPKTQRFIFVRGPLGVVVETPAETEAVEDGAVLAAVESWLGSMGYFVSRGILSPDDFGSALSDEHIYIVGTRRRVPFQWPEGLVKSANLVLATADLAPSETMRMLGYPDGWLALTVVKGEAERLIDHATPVPVARAMLEGTIKAIRRDLC